MLKNQVLIVGPPRSGKLSILTQVLGVSEDTIKEVIEDNDNSTTHSGLTFKDVSIQNKYYDTTINVWIDEFDDDSPRSMSNWCSEFLSDEYREIRDVIQGIIFTVRRGSDYKYSDELCKQLDLISETLDSEFLEVDEQQGEDAGFQWPGFKLVVVSDKRAAEDLPSDKDISKESEWMVEFEDKALLSSFDFVDLCPSDKAQENEYGEKVGKERVFEVFISNEWKEIDKKHGKTSTKNNNEKMGELLKPLLNNENDETEEDLGSEMSIEQLDKVIKKLQQAKITVSSTQFTDTKTKENYVTDLVNEIVNNF